MKSGFFAPARRLISATFLMEFAGGLVGLGTTELGIHLRASPFTLGLFGTLGSAAFALACLFTGRLSDAHGRRRATVVGCLLTGGAWLAISRATGPAQILWLVPLSGLGGALYWPPLQAWLAELSDGGRRGLNRNLGLYNLSWCTGCVLGAIVCGYLWVRGQALPFYVGVAAIAVILVISVTTPRGVRQTPQTEGEHASPPNARLFMHLAWIANFAAWFGVSLVKSLFPKLGDDIGFSARLVGWVVASIHIAQLLSFWAARRSEKWQYRLWPLLTTQAMALVGMVIAWYTRSAVVFAGAFAMAGICAGAAYITSIFYSLHGNVDDRGGKAGLHEAILGSGTLFGPLLGGALANVAGVSVAFLLAGAVYAVAIGAELSLWQRARMRATICPGATAG